MRISQRLRSALVPAIVVVGATLANSAPVSAGLVAHWAMDEAVWDQVSYDVADSSGMGHNGRAYAGAKTVAEGRIGRGGSFSGSYVAVPQDAATGFLDLDRDGTVTCWVNFSDLQLPNATHRILGTPSYQNGLLLNQYGTVFATYWTSHTGGAQKWITGALAADQWYHLAVANVDGTFRVYINGQLQGSAAAQGTLAFNEQMLYIGGPASWDIEGLIDDVAIWSNGLDEAKVRSIYTVPEDLGLSYNVGDMIALWDIYDSGVDATIKGIPWQFTSALPDPPAGGPPALGDAYVADGVMYVALGNGTGLAAVPEPSAFLIAALSLPALGLIGRRRRRRRVAQA